MTLLSDAPARDDAPDREPRPRLAVAFAAGAAIAAGIALYAYSRSEMWLDEALSVNIARLPLGDLRSALEHDGAPPLYYAMLHAWTGAFGTGNEAARSLSALFGVGALVGLWFAGRRLGGTRLAWIVVVVTATNPYAIRYATEARMYMLELFLVAWGIVAVQWALDRPTLARLAPVAVITAALVLTQYWAFYLIGVVGLALLTVAWRDPSRRAAALRVVAAIAVGGLVFLFWLPTFLSQREHTGTPWGDPVLPALPIGETLLGFSGGEEQEGWALLLVAFPLLLVGVFARALDGRHLEVDLWGQPRARWFAAVGAGTLIVGTILSYLAGQAFEARYSVIVFPFFVLLVGLGITAFTDDRVRMGVLVVVVGLGLVGGLRNATEQRTQAGQVAAVLTAEAQPGDVVVACPDQLGPSVHRLGPGGLDEVTYPDLTSTAFVDWVDYQERLDAADPTAFAEAVVARAGTRTIWFVTGPGYPNHQGACEAVSAALTARRERVGRVLPSDDYFEKPGLQQFPPGS
ncbi:MAG: glycosyltransferase family 39 protein [Acidimicrobiia bacterium]